MSLLPCRTVFYLLIGILSFDYFIFFRRSQRTDWRTERKLNSETFGVASARRGGFRGRGGYYNLGRGLYRGGAGGSYRGNYNRGQGNRPRNTNNPSSNNRPPIAAVK